MLKLQRMKAAHPPLLLAVSSIQLGDRYWRRAWLASLR